jgi:hypothetical protein
MDYSDFKSAKLPDWECHQTYSMGYDSLSGGTFLEVTAFPKKTYPGFSMPWITGNWSPYTTLRITARMRGHASPFILSVWDGNGKYVMENRFEKKFAVDTVWTTCELSFSGGLATPGARRMDLGRITQVVFFYGRSGRPDDF